MVKIEEGKGVRSILNSRNKIIGHILEGGITERVEVKNSAFTHKETFYLIKGSDGKAIAMLYEK